MAMFAHLVGSIGLPTSGEVFSVVGQGLGNHIKRCPDGEPGGRRMWIGWQWPVLRANYGLKLASLQSIGHSGLCPFKIKEGATDDDLSFGELGYYREALGSYSEFSKARESGLLPSGVRFQVCLPTPWAVISSFIDRADAQRLLPFYRDAMVQEMLRICAAIPHEDLAIQWDVCMEMIHWDGRFEWYPPFDGMRQFFEKEFAVLGNGVPVDVQLGVHLCYGDLDGEHFVQPVDTAKAVEFAQLIMSSIVRPLNWVHLPVPRDRDDVAYFAPLANLKRDHETELYLGLIHADDDGEGNARRIAAARQVISQFGIATECGIARARTADIVKKIIYLHAKAASSEAA